MDVAASMLENSRYQMPAHFRAVVGVAGQILGEKRLFVGEPPDQAEGGEDGGDEPPVGPERQGQPDEVDRRARVHRIPHNRVGAGGDHSLILANLDGRGAEGVLAEDPVHQPHAEDDEQVAHEGDPGGHARPAEAMVEPRDDERGDGRQSRAQHDDSLDGSLLSGRPTARPVLILAYLVLTIRRGR